MMRKLIVFGNCQAANVFNVLARAPGVVDVFDVVHHEVWAEGEALRANVADFADADILALQDLRDWRHHPMREKLPPSLRVVRFPFLYIAALWPFDAFLYGPDVEIINRSQSFGFQDGLMARLRTEIPDPDDRFRRYAALDLPDLPDTARYAELEEARLLRDDARLGMGIGRFIVDRYRRERLFHAVTHLAPLLVERLAWEILCKLDLDPGLEHVPSFYDYMAFYQVPVHPRIIETLGLAWVSLSSVYRFSATEELDFETYFRRYIEAGG